MHPPFGILPYAFHGNVDTLQHSKLVRGTFYHKGKKYVRNRKYVIKKVKLGLLIYKIYRLCIGFL